MEQAPRILIVEDDRAICDFLGLALADEGYTVAMAENGWTGLTIVDTFQPDLILLDMRLPVMSGQEFITIYQGSPRPAPIIGISASQGAKQLAENLGVADFVEKPFSLDILFDRIERCLSDNRGM